MRSIVALFPVALVACASQGPSPRAPGARTPMSAACDAVDGTRCLLPWPSNTFTVADPATPAGLRVSIALRSLPVLDNPAPLNRLDGFSVASTLAAGFPEALAPGLAGQKQTTAVRLLSFRADPEVPLRLHVVADGTSEASLLLACPMRPLASDTDCVAVVLDEVQPARGGRFETPRPVQLAVGVATAATDEERALVAYHAPTRALLARAGIDGQRVLRAWDFTTRSAASVARPLALMRAQALDAVDAGALEVQVLSATPRAGGGLEVRGRVGGLPRFINDAGVLELGDEGLPVMTGVHEAPFRAVLPVGNGALPVVVFGHGTGNSVNDTGLDDELLATGAAKLNLEFAGWTGTSVPTTFLGFEHIFSGSERSTAGLAQSSIDASALEAALGAQLGAVLTSPTLAGQQNPAAGRTFDAERLAYFGSSLGGTLDFAHAQAEPRIHAAVLNVPGAGCGQFLLHAEQWGPLDVIFAASTPSAIDRARAAHRVPRKRVGGGAAGGRASDLRRPADGLRLSRRAVNDD